MRGTAGNSASSEAARTFTSFDKLPNGEALIPAGSVQFEKSELGDVFKRYAAASNRSIIQAFGLPDVRISYVNQRAMNRIELLQALDTVLAAQGIAMVAMGREYVKAVEAKNAALEPGLVMEAKRELLPESDSFVICVVRLRKSRMADAMPVIQPFAKLPNSIVGIGSKREKSSLKNGLVQMPFGVFGSDDELLILRDYSSNVRRMLEVLEQLENR